MNMNKTIMRKRGERTYFKDTNGKYVYVKDCIQFLFWETGSDGMQHEHYYFGRIVKRGNKLVFRYKPDGVNWSERRLDVLHFDSEMEWTIYYSPTWKQIKS